MRIPIVLVCLAACVAPRTEPDPAEEAQEMDEPTPFQVDPDVERGAIATVVDDWHDAAAQADEARYLGHFTSDAVFMGTDASERWTLEEFTEYVRRYFPQGGWTYLPHDRHVVLSADGTLGWFDEQLTNAGYGELRGTGVVRREEGAWKLAHYSMTFTVPNDVARQVVQQIKDWKAANRDEGQ